MHVPNSILSSAHPSRAGPRSVCTLLKTRRDLTLTWQVSRSNGRHVERGRHLRRVWHAYGSRWCSWRPHAHSCSVLWTEHSTVGSSRARGRLLVACYSRLGDLTSQRGALSLSAGTQNISDIVWCSSVWLRGRGDLVGRAALRRRRPVAGRRIAMVLVGRHVVAPRWMHGWVPA